MKSVTFFKKALLLVAAGILAQSAMAQDSAIPLGHQPEEEASVLEVVDAFMSSLTTKDIEKRTSLQTTDGMTYTAVHRPDGTWRVVSRPNSIFTDPANESSNELVEKIWAPVVIIRGPLAMVWSPFEFWLDGNTSHCGVNLMQLVKTDGTWKLANTMWTHEPEACEELRPADLTTMRP